MITQQHDNEIQQKAQASSPVKLHRWVVVLLSILGVAVPLVAGWWENWPLVEVNLPGNDWTLPALGYVVLPVAVGAFLLCFAFRTWWVTVFAGVAWIVGELLSGMLRPLVEGGQPMLEVQVTKIILALVPLIIGMLIGWGIALLLVYLRERGQSRQ